MNEPIRVSIETSSRAGGVAVGAGDRLLRAVDFDAGYRQATQLIARLDDVLAEVGVRPAEVEELYIATGPGGFTGLRIGVTVARTWAQAVPGLRCVAVPTAAVVAGQLADESWSHLAVLLNAKADTVHTTYFDRGADGVPAERAEPPAGMKTAARIVAEAPGPALLAGEGLAYVRPERDDFTCADPAVAIPTAEGTWRVGRRMAAAGQFVPATQLLPVYARAPEAVRLWEQRHGVASE